MLFSKINNFRTRYASAMDKVLREDAEQGDFAAQFDLAVRYDHEGDYSEALRWYSKAAEQGLAEAQFNVGLMYAKGRGVGEDIDEAIRWYRNAAEQGLAEAQCNLGLILTKVENSAENAPEALLWLHRAAEQGNALAQYNLGMMYDDSVGIPQNTAEAARWLRRAAEQGLAEAQFVLGLMYTNGEGVAEDNDEAIRWHEMAAKRGHASAQFALGILHFHVHGDCVQAYAWTSLAIAQGCEPVDETLRLQETIAEEITDNELAKAKRLSEKYWNAYVVPFTEQ